MLIGLDARAQRLLHLTRPSAAARREFKNGVGHFHSLKSVVYVCGLYNTQKNGAMLFFDCVTIINVSMTQIKCF
jgi:hypothetical protein